MIELTEIKAALVDILETVPGVDVVNAYGWFPDLMAAGVGITIPPLRTESLYGFKQSRGTGIDFQSHRFFCEVWVRDDGDPQALNAAMTGINTAAVTTLMTAKTFTVGTATAYLAWYDGNSFDYAITFEVEDGWRRVVNDGPTYLVAILSVPVTLGE